MTDSARGSDPLAPGVPSADGSPQYEFVKLLGRGGMAEVLLAHKFAPSGGFKEVAFKRILPQFTEDPSRIARFMDEIAVAASLVHPNIVGVHHWGQYEGDYFIEMELVRGLTLMGLIEALAPEGAEHGRLLPVEVAFIGAQMAEGLHYAHTFERTSTDGRHLTGVVHRDISPDNVMLDLHGFAKINDWGISKALKGADRVASKTTTAAGKPCYHPPEQWRGDEVDARTDLYAVGTTLSLALCGRQLFPSGPHETFESVVYRVFQGDRPPIADIAPPDTPPALIELLESLVQADRDLRPRTAKELIRPLKNVVRELAGDLDSAKERLAARVKEHYGGDSDTHRALRPPQFSNSDVPVRSTKRRIDPATRPDKPPVAQTAPLPAHDPSSGAPSTAPLPGPRQAHPILWAVAGALTLLVILLAGVAGFVFGGHGEDPTTQSAGAAAGESPPEEESALSVAANATPTERPAGDPEAAPADEGARQEGADEHPSAVDSTSSPEPASADDGTAPATPAETSGLANLRVIVIPFGEASLDGRPISVRSAHSVAAGAHRLTATSGGRRQTREIELEPGQSQRVVFRF